MPKTLVSAWQADFAELFAARSFSSSFDIYSHSLIPLSLEGFA